MNVAATVPQREANPQLSLPTGPFTSFRGGRRDRKDEDRDFLSAVFKVKAGECRQRRSTGALGTTLL